MTIADWLIILAVFLGPVVAVRVTRYLDDQREIRERKVQIFKTLMATRSYSVSWAHVEALNKIDLEFDKDVAKEKEVIEMWKEYLGPVHTKYRICYHPRMELTEAQYARIAPHLPVQRGNVRLSNLQALNAILYVAEHGCKWRGLPGRFGKWHTVYTRMNRWAKSGVLDRVFEHLQREQILQIKLEAVSLDSTIIKVHPDGTGARKKTAPRPSANLGAAGPPNCIWLPRMLARL